MIENKAVNWQFWVDRGGTFTDIVAKDPNGKLSSYKFLSENPEQYKDAAVYGIRKILNIDAESTIPVGAIDAVKMGTTVATNALLERKGDRTLLLITAGFKDLLRIGYQNRPHIFELNISLPELLYEEVSEVKERIGSKGEIILPLNEKAVIEALNNSYNKGIRSVAIALVFGYKHIEHEKRVAQLAHQAGFTQISVSHKVSPLIKLVSRGDTTVVDAYLSPVLRRYVNQVNDALDKKNSGCKSLMFMQSNGGLTDADLFQGKDAILSGPAGGVVGMVNTAKVAGFDKLIGFDMGGTSTDVCHYAGDFERSFETEIAGVRMRAPMMNIHTVAAGGGSILFYEHGRFRVGPESAGANPGPASYRRGGPLTVTDCNVMLGKIQSEQFPRVFGPNADEPLDPEIVQDGFKKLAHKINKELGKEFSAEEVAEGFLRIAVDNMANAIKKISVQRGYDVTKYTLNCFGGAGGQHVCQVADSLGIEHIFVHPFAGVLSAFGMGLADIRAMRERQFEQPLSEVLSAAKILEEIDKEVLDEIKSQGIKNNITVKQQAHLRYKDSHKSIPVRFSRADAMLKEFEGIHKDRYGFVPKSGELIIELLSSEAIASMESESDNVISYDNSTPKDYIVRKNAQMYSQGEWIEVPLIKREELTADQIIKGPAIIIESTGTNIIEDGWSVKIDNLNNLIIERTEVKKSFEIIDDSPDPIMLEVFNNLFMSIAEQMGETLANTAYSVNIKERLDFSCAIFDDAGGLVANAPHVPVHLGSMGDSVRSILKSNKGNIHPGDTFMMNNPFNGGTHLPDVTVITPIFDNEGSDLIFVVASRGHHADIGGKTPGSSPSDSTHIEEEGVVIDNFKLVDENIFQEVPAGKLLASGKYPCRNIDHNMADLVAQIAANNTGVKELNKLVSQFGIKIVHSYMRHVQNNAEETVRQAISVLKDSEYLYELDSGKKIKVSLIINHSERSVLIDFTGTSGQVVGNYNAPKSICQAAVIYVFRTLVGENIPLNEGSMKPLSIVIPKSSMINPDYPAAVIAGNTEVSQAITETLFGALGILASSQGTMNNFVYGNQDYQNYETIGGGAGAGPDFDGADAVQTHMTNTRMTDVEVLESRFPVRVEEFSIRKNSGGKGKFKGGCGITRKIRFLDSMQMTVLSSNRICRPFGINGGEPGLSGKNYIKRSNGEFENLNGNDSANVKKDDVFIMETPGGGGYGKTES